MFSPYQKILNISIWGYVNNFECINTLLVNSFWKIARWQLQHWNEKTWHWISRSIHLAFKSLTLTHDSGFRLQICLVNHVPGSYVNHSALLVYLPQKSLYKKWETKSTVGKRPEVTTPDVIRGKPPDADKEAASVIVTHYKSSPIVGWITFRLNEMGSVSTKDGNCLIWRKWEKKLLEAHV